MDDMTFSRAPTAPIIIGMNYGLCIPKRIPDFNIDKQYHPYKTKGNNIIVWMNGREYFEYTHNHGFTDFGKRREKSLR
jgi:hypothetical protein